MKERLLDVVKWGLILIISGAVVYLLTRFSEFGVLGMWITAIATAAIAIHAFMSYQLASKIQSRDEEYRQQVRDLYEAIAISSLMGSPVQVESSEFERRIEKFKKLYQGKTPIFTKGGD